MLLEKLEQEGIKKELEALGYNCEEIFGGLKEETDRLYASYSWQKIPCTVEGIREYVIHAVPAEEASGEGLSLGGVVYPVRRTGTPRTVYARSGDLQCGSADSGGRYTASGGDLRKNLVLLRR